MPISQSYDVSQYLSILTVLQKALNERGIDKMLREVRDDNRENDAEHMKPVSDKSDVAARLY